jgi:DNA-binding MarR family transcriptional regulator
MYIHLLAMTSPSLPVLPCMCATLRRASRALTQVYEDALRHAGLHATQFTILQALTLAGGVTQGKLGTMLAMDSTTLTRTLGIMIRRRWVARRRGTDRREWRLALTEHGKEKFKQATPFWEQAQAQVLGKLGTERWDQLVKLSNTVTAVVTE